MRALWEGILQQKRLQQASPNTFKVTQFPIIIKIVSLERITARHAAPHPSK